MKLVLIKLFSFCILFSSCKTKYKNHSVSTAENNTKQKTIIDTINYSTLPYWTDSINRFSEAYIDTFSVGENKFRFVNPIASHRTGMNIITLQKFVNNKWTKTKLTLEDSPHGGYYYHNQDVNGDGFNDIVFGYRYTETVHFFDPSKNNYIVEGSSDFINPNWFLIDKKKNIYCDFQEYKGLCNQIHSQLYTYNGFQKVKLYDLKLDNCSNTNNENNLIHKLVLSKFLYVDKDSTEIIEEIKLDNPIDTEKGELLKQYSDNSYYYFDYRKFWKDRYKKIMGSS
jgi:hypothetical protein